MTRRPRGLGAWEPPEDGARTHEVRSDHLGDNPALDLGGNGDVQGAPALWTSASKKPTDARSLSPWHEVSPYHHHNHHNHDDDNQTAPPGEPNVAKWRSRWPSTRRSLSASKTSSPPLQITLPNAWSVLILRI